jgi:hypothetical protein
MRRENPLLFPERRTLTVPKEPPQRGHFKRTSPISAPPKMMMNNAYNQPGSVCEVEKPIEAAQPSQAANATTKQIVLRRAKTWRMVT